jgi:hypothetical protein
MYEQSILKEIIILQLSSSHLPALLHDSHTLLHAVGQVCQGDRERNPVMGLTATCPVLAMQEHPGVGGVGTGANGRRNVKNKYTKEGRCWRLDHQKFYQI